MSIKGQRTRFTSFMRVPLLRELRLKVLEKYPNYYGEFIHKTHCFYSHGSINEVKQKIENWLETLPKN